MEENDVMIAAEPAVAAYPIISDDADWKDWMLSPNVNATVMLQSKKRRASISLGGDEYSYYARIDGKDVGENHIDFNPAGFLSLMQNLDR